MGSSTEAPFDAPPDWLNTNSLASPGPSGVFVSLFVSHSPPLPSSSPLELRPCPFAALDRTDCANPDVPPDEVNASPRGSTSRGFEADAPPATGADVDSDCVEVEANPSPPAVLNILPSILAGGPSLGCGEVGAGAPEEELAGTELCASDPATSCSDLFVFASTRRSGGCTFNSAAVWLADRVCGDPEGPCPLREGPREEGMAGECGWGIARLTEGAIDPPDGEVGEPARCTLCIMLMGRGGVLDDFPQPLPLPWWCISPLSMPRVLTTMPPSTIAVPA